MMVRPVRREDGAAWLKLRIELWPEEDAGLLAQDAEDHFTDAQSPRQHVLLCEDGGEIIGMIELSERAYAEGCETSPVAFIEGWCVAAHRRGQGVGRALVAAAEDWARSRGHTEIGSDTQLWNEASQKAHAALGYEEVERIVAFRKALG